MSSQPISLKWPTKQFPTIPAPITTHRALFGNSLTLDPLSLTSDVSTLRPYPTLRRSFDARLDADKTCTTPHKNSVIWNCSVV